VPLCIICWCYWRLESKVKQQNNNFKDGQSFRHQSLRRKTSPNHSSRKASARSLGTETEGRKLSKNSKRDSQVFSRATTFRSKSDAKKTISVSVTNIRFLVWSLVASFVLCWTPGFKFFICLRYSKRSILLNSGANFYAIRLMS